jgi:hypothetical protein
MDSGRYVILFGKSHAYDDPDVYLRVFIPDVGDVAYVSITDYENKEVMSFEVGLEELAAFADELRRSIK